MGWLKAMAFALFLLGLEFAAQGWIEWREVQAGFRLDVQQTICSPITGRELPVVGTHWTGDDWWHEQAALAAKGE